MGLLEEGDAQTNNDDATTMPTMRRVVGFWVVEVLMKRPPDLFFSIITLQEGRRNQYCTILCFIVENSSSQVFFQPGLVQPLADDDEHLLSLRDGGRRQTGGGSIQLVPPAIVFHEAFHPEDVSTGGVDEEGRDVLFQLSAGQAQLEEVG